jgi:hypothetical protein
MKKLLLFIICVIVIPALTLMGIGVYLYDSYLKPTPTEYDFLRGESEVCTVEYAIISFGEDGSVNTQRVGFVDDVQGFVTDLKALDCYDGMPTQSLMALKDIKTLSGFVINYTDGSFEVITPYVCLNSDLKINSPEELLTAEVYVFDKDGINEMLIKYAPSSSDVTNS